MRVIGAHFTPVDSTCDRPFGGARQTTGTLPTDRLFTGQIRDLGDDRFYFFKARYYDAAIGKLIQPDPLAPVVGKPPSLNRYAYADNNPLRYRDSTGHYTESSKEMTSPGIVINNPPPPDNKPLIYVAPSLPSGPLIFTGGLNLPTINVTTQPDMKLGQALIFVQGDQSLRPSIAAFEERIEKVLQGLSKHGVLVAADQTARLRLEGARASYIGPFEELPPTVSVGDDTTYGAVMEEAHHFGTDRRNSFAPQATEDRLREEIQAGNCLLQNAGRWRLSEVEIHETQTTLAMYQRQLEDLIGGKEVLGD